MNEPNDIEIGRRVLEEGKVTPDQLLDVVLSLADERKAREGQMKPRSLGAILVDRRLISQPDLERMFVERDSPASVSPEADQQIGKAIVEAGHATQAQIEECLRIQESEKAAGARGRRLGEILVERRYLTQAKLLATIVLRRRSSYACTGCGLRFNILKAQPGARYVCKKCGEKLESAVKGVADIEPPRSLAPEEVQIDLAMAVYMRQKNMLRLPALREAERVQRDLAFYGIEVRLLDVLQRRKLIGWQQQEQLKTVDFAKIVKSETWLKQTVPGYTAVGKVASGGFATIFLAEPVFGGVTVALKMLHPDRARDPVSVERFRQEGTLMMRLGHPHIVKAYEQGEHRGFYYITMELVKGEPLENKVKREGAMEPALALKIARQVAEALYHMQQEGCIHRDMKPENILLNQENDAKVCDLGFAAGFRKDVEGLAQMTLGTASYVSPEQARGELDLKIGTDIYSLGLTLYFMLSGRQPFEGESTEIIMTERFASGVAAPDFHRMVAPEPIVKIVKRMLHPIRAERFTTYPDLIAALRDVKF